jgi:SnoaL-like domain
VSRGDVDAISSVLAEDVVLYGDNAGKPGAVIRPPLVGREKVARFFAARIAKWPPSPALDVEVTDVNGWPAIVARRGGVVVFVINIETDGAQIATIRSLLNPEKLFLRHVN